MATKKTSRHAATEKEMREEFARSVAAEVGSTPKIVKLILDVLLALMKHGYLNLVLSVLQSINRRGKELEVEEREKEKED